MTKYITNIVIDCGHYALFENKILYLNHEISLRFKVLSVLFSPFLAYMGFKKTYIIFGAATSVVKAPFVLAVSIGPYAKI